MLIVTIVGTALWGGETSQNSAGRGGPRSQATQRLLHVSIQKFSYKSVRPVGREKLGKTENSNSSLLTDSVN